ncbi:putative gustatory receptor 59b [Drosophila grimshawi]|uniref:putative gustatory receptor 59b n=1 Tax=Drosophila grimshawi TaxID=7222 RepID=UPI001C93649D|nr:putative gustatory receptor 59b [Drosophila grimshawi]
MVTPHWILWLYHNYALVLGITSLRWISGEGLKQTNLTRFYALILNIVELLTVPYFMWITMGYINKAKWFPDQLPYATQVLFSVSYVAIAHTIISRGSRDEALLEVDSIVNRLKCLKSEKNRLSSTCDSMSYVFYLKMGAVIYMCVYGMTSCLLVLREKNLLLFLQIFVFGTALNFSLIAIYRYFLALWDIACCYQYIKGKLEHLMNCVRNRYPTQVELEELHRLWSLHALLGRSTLKFNRTHGLLIMLLVDFFLLNFMCDLTTQYQNYAYHSVSEGYWFKELNAYLLYASTSKLNLWVCGLYKVNRKCWYQMLLSILNLLILLLQFHLLLRKKFTLDST